MKYLIQNKIRSPPTNLPHIEDVVYNNEIKTQLFERGDIYKNILFY